MGIFDVEYGGGALTADEALEDSSRAKTVEELLAESNRSRGETGITPDLSVSRLGGAVVEELKMGVRDRLVGVGMIEESVEDKGRRLRERRIQDIRKLQEKTGQYQQIPRMTERVKYRGAAEDILALAASDALKADPDFEVSSGFIEDQIRSLTQVGQQVLTAALAGPVAGISDMGLMIFGGTYKRLERDIPEIANKLIAGSLDEMGMPMLSEADAMAQATARVKTASFVNAIAQSPFEYLGISKLTKLLKPQKQAIRLIKKLTEIAGVEGATEYLQSMGPELLASIWAKNPDKDVLKLYGKELNKLENHIDALKQAGHAALSSVIIGSGRARKQVKQEIQEEKVSEEAKLLEEKALEAEAAAMPVSENAGSFAELAKAEEALKEEAPVEETVEEQAKVEEIQDSFLDMVAKANEVVGKHVDQGSSKMSDIIASKAEIEELATQLEDIKAKVAEAEAAAEPAPVAEEIKPETEEKPDVPVEKLPTKVKKQASLKDLEQPAGLTKEGKEREETKEDETDQASKELGLDVKVPEEKPKTEDRPPSKIAPGFDKLGQAGVWKDGKVIETVKIPKVKGKSLHTKKQRNQIKNAWKRLAKKHGADAEFVFVDDNGTAYRRDEVAADKVGTEEGLADATPSDVNATYNKKTGELTPQPGAGSVARAAKAARDEKTRKDAEKKADQKRLAEAGKAGALRKGSKKRKYFDSLMERVRGAAAKMSKGNQADMDDLVSMSTVPMIEEALKDKPTKDFSVGFYVKNALKDIRTRGLGVSRRVVEEGDAPKTQQHKEDKGTGAKSETAFDRGELKKNTMTSRAEEERAVGTTESAAKAKDLKGIKSQQDLIEEEGKLLGIKIDINDPDQTLANIEEAKKLARNDFAKTARIEVLEENIDVLMPRGTVADMNIKNKKDRLEAAKARREKQIEFEKTRGRADGLVWDKKKQEWVPRDDVTVLKGQEVEERFKAGEPVSAFTKKEIAALKKKGIMTERSRKDIRTAKKKEWTLRETIKPKTRKGYKTRGTAAAELKRRKAKQPQKYTNTKIVKTKDGYVIKVMERTDVAGVQSDRSSKFLSTEPISVPDESIGLQEVPIGKGVEKSREEIAQEENRANAGGIQQKQLKTERVFDPEKVTYEKNQAGNYWKKRGPAEAALLRKKAGKNKDKYQHADVQSLGKGKYHIRIQVPFTGQVVHDYGKMPAEPTGTPVSVDEAIDTINKDRARFDRELRQALEMREGTPEREAKLQRMQDRVDRRVAEVMQVERQNATKVQKRKLKIAKAKLKEIQDAVNFENDLFSGTQQEILDKAVLKEAEKRGLTTEPAAPIEKVEKDFPKTAMGAAIEKGMVEKAKQERYEERQKKLEARHERIKNRKPIGTLKKGTAKGMLDILKSNKGEVVIRQGDKLALDKPVAVLYKGKIYTGNMHGTIKVEVADELGIDYDTMERDSIDGFVTESGKFLDRKQAAKLAKDTGYLDKNPVSTPKELEEFGLDSVDLDIDRMDAEDEAMWEAAQKLYQSGPAVKTVLGSILNNNRGSVTTEPLQAVANKMAKWGRSIADLTDVEARWKRMKADATGLAVKTFHSVSQSYEDIAMKVATDIVKEVKRAYPGITKGKAHDELLADVVLGAEKKETFDSWSVEKQNKLRKPVSMLRKYFDDSLAQYQENGIEGIDYYKNKIAQQRKAMGKMKDINQMSDMNRKLGELEKLSFVHLPKSQWFPGADTRDTRTKRQMERAKKRRAFDILVAKRKRHAVSMHDLVERGVLEKREIDPVSMLLNYGQQVGRDMAMVNLREAGLEDGFVSDAKTKPMSLRALNAKLVKLNENLTNAKGKRVQAIEKSITALEKKITALERVYNTDDTAQWEKMPSQEYSAFKGLWVDSRLRDALNNTLASDDRQSWYEKQVSTIKMAQFYNPIFMPIYDLWQAGAMGGLIRHPAQWMKNIGRAARDVEEVSDRHQRASQWGTFSKPFSNPIANRDKQVRAIKEATKYDGISGSLLDALKTLGMEQFTKRAVSKENRSILGLPVGGLYTAAWNSAWKMDAVIRQGTFNYLTERGMSDKEAAQTAAKIHADYAGVPAKTRKAMNKVIFTPTFAISMVKVQTAMVNEAIRFAMRRGQTKSQKQLALGAATTTATIVGMHLYMISQGYEPDKFGRVYTKTVDTPNGPREIKVNLTTPLTKGLKYLNWLIDYAYKPLTGGDPAKTEVLGDFMKTLSYEGTPLLRTIMGLKTNQKPNGDKIYYGMDKGYMKALKMTEYVMKDTLAFFDQGGQTFGRVNAEDNKELEKELGTMFLILKRMQTVFVSSRSDKDRRFSGALQGIKSDFEADVKQYMKRNPDGDLTPMMEEYERRLNQLQENYENE